MAKNDTQNVKASNVAVVEAKEVTKTQEPASKPLARKATIILKLLSVGPLTRKGIVEASVAAKTPVSSPDTTAYLGSVKEDVRSHWDRVAMDPEVKSWNHVSLMGRGLVVYDAVNKTFKLTSEGEKLAKTN